MRLWYASAVSGMEDVAAALLKEGGAVNVTPVKGALLFERAEPPSAPYLNNVFQVLIKAPCRSLDEACVHALQCLDGVAFPSSGAHTFRVVAMEDGALRPLEGRVMRALEARIARRSSLSVRRANPDAEVWLNVRSEGFYTLMLRLYKHKPFDKALKPGQLRPDLCATLAALARVERRHTALDPFAGWGAIANALRARCGSVVAGDADEACVRHMRAHCPGVDVRLMDARATGMPAGSVDAIVTDPPWGRYAPLPDAHSLYAAFLAEAARVLRPGGIVIVLSALPVDAWAEPPLRTTFIYPVRVNGKQARVYVIEHRG